MKSMICFIACVALASAQILVGDDGQWRPALDGSWLGSGLDGQWNPLADGSLAGSPLLARSALLGHPLIHALKKRSVYASPLATAGIVSPLAYHHAGLIAAPGVVAHSPVLAHSAVVGHSIVGHSAVIGHPLIHALKKRSVYASPLIASPLAVTRITPATALAHNAQVVTSLNGLVAAPGVVAHSPVLAHSAVVGHSLVGHSAVIGHPLIHALKKRSVYATPLIASPLAVTRITPATALAHNAQVIAPVHGVHGVVASHGLVAGHSLLGARSLLW